MTSRRCRRRLWASMRAALGAAAEAILAAPDAGLARRCRAGGETAPEAAGPEPLSAEDIRALVRNKADAADAIDSHQAPERARTSAMTG